MSISPDVHPAGLRYQCVEMDDAVPVKLLTNSEMASRLEELARVLEDQDANPFRVKAYHTAAQTIREWREPVAELARRQGIAGLREELPGIGERLGQTVYQLAMTGQLPMLARLRGEAEPVEVLASVIGIGPTTARRIHERLGIHTLEELEMAAHDGRLERLGIGPKRLHGVRDALAGRLGRAGRRQPAEDASVPDIAEVLDVDEEYRQKAASGSLPRIAPRRFNPTHEAWLPVLHTQRGDRHYTVLFSNTARAHELGRTADWVVMFFDGKGGERQCTVVTGARGALRGRRVVAGRNGECLQYYRDGTAAAVPTA